MILVVRSRRRGKHGSEKGNEAGVAHGSRRESFAGRRTFAAIL
jgi:hypothetical protein